LKTDPELIVKFLRSHATLESVTADVAFAILAQAVRDACSTGVLIATGSGALSPRTGKRHGEAASSALREDARLWLTGDRCAAVLESVKLRHSWLNGILLKHTEWARPQEMREAA
jgi:hypothetical protein